MNMLGNFGKFVITSLLLFAFVGVGYFVGQEGDAPDFVSSAHAFPANLPWESASSGKQLSMATGRIEEGGKAVDDGQIIRGLGDCGSDCQVGEERVRPG